MIRAIDLSMQDFKTTIASLVYSGRIDLARNIARQIGFKQEIIDDMIYRIETEMEANRQHTLDDF